MLCIGLVLVLAAPFSVSVTDPFDVMAINGLYLSLGSPPLAGWIPNGGDPCGEAWQGVNCVFSNITEVRLNGLNLGGTLEAAIANFESIILFDVSNNHIGGSIPPSLPATLRNLSLAGNNFTGSIPDLSALSQLLDLSLNDNHLSDGIPDSFQLLNGLINMDLSGNNLSGQLPLSFGNLSSLNMLHLQNNKLGGMLDVIQDLPLLDLDIENNLFSGPIPPKLLTSVPNFRREGNPFNTTILPSPPAALPPSIAGAPFSAPPPGEGDGGQAIGPSILQPPLSEKAKKTWINNKLTWIVAAVVLVVVVLGVCLLVWRCAVSRHADHSNGKNGINAFLGPTEKPSKSNISTLQPTVQTEKVPKETVARMKDEYGVYSGRMAESPKLQDEHVIDVMKMPSNSKNKNDHEISMKGVDLSSTAQHPKIPAPPIPPVERVIVNPPEAAVLDRGGNASTSQSSTISASVFSIASLQQYTNSFSEENFVGEGILGSVYRAELPDGKLLAVKKLDAKSSDLLNDEEFFGLVSSISQLKHPNILELSGYCNEHGQRLLVFKYCKNGSLYDALHVDDELHGKLTWDARVRVALGAARALQYLHEVCQPPVMHRNLKSSNVLLDEKFAVHVSDCILAPHLLSGSADELSGTLVCSGYGAQEIELGNYTVQSDVYSLGIVMLELLTGRKPFDRSRPRGEQSLVRWAVPQLHDIDAISKMVDTSLKGAYPGKSLSRFADIISRCVQWEPGFRPPISEIVQDLLHMI